MVVTYPLKDIWPVVLPRISAIRKRFIKHCDWTEDDVYLACWERRFNLFCSSEDDSFCIAKLKFRGGRRILFVWIAYGANGKREENLGLLQEIAQGVGADLIEMESPRRGFDRFPGWERGMTRYSMEVNDGRRG